MRFVIFFLSLCFIPSVVIGSDKEYADRYLQKRIDRFEDAIAKCDQIIKNRSVPDDSVMKVLRQFDFEHVRAFLIPRSVQAEENCQKPELTELAYAVGVLGSASLSDDTREKLEWAKGLIFGSETWGLKARYHEVPDELKDKLEGISYFHKPFDDSAILDAL